MNDSLLYESHGCQNQGKPDYFVLQTMIKKKMKCLKHVSKHGYIYSSVQQATFLFCMLMITVALNSVAAFKFSIAPCGAYPWVKYVERTFIDPLNLSNLSV